MKKKKSVTLIIIILVIFLSIIIMTRSHPETSKETTKCIGKNSALYTQLGCSACQIQEDMFGDNYQYLNIIDCWFEREKCGGIEYTPTWIIKGDKYVGVQSIEELKNLTGCQ